MLVGDGKGLSIQARRCNHGMSQLEYVFPHWKYIQRDLCKWDDTCSVSTSGTLHSSLAAIGDYVILSEQIPSVNSANARQKERTIVIPARAVHGLREQQAASRMRCLSIPDDIFDNLINKRAAYLRLREDEFEDGSPAYTFLWPKEVLRQSFDGFAVGSTAEAPNMVLKGNVASVAGDLGESVMSVAEKGKPDVLFNIALGKLPLHEPQHHLTTSGSSIPGFVVGPRAWAILHSDVISSSGVDNGLSSTSVHIQVCNNGTVGFNPLPSTIVYIVQNASYTCNTAPIGSVLDRAFIQSTGDIKGDAARFVLRSAILGSPLTVSNSPLPSVTEALLCLPSHCRRLVSLVIKQTNARRSGTTFVRADEEQLSKDGLSSAKAVLLTLVPEFSAECTLPLSLVPTVLELTKDGPLPSNFDTARARLHDCAPEIFELIREVKDGSAATAHLVTTFLRGLCELITSQLLSTIAPPPWEPIPNTYNPPARGKTCLLM